MSDYRSHLAASLTSDWRVGRTLTRLLALFVCLAGASMGVWDPTPSWTKNVYDVSNKGQTVIKARENS